MQSMQKCLKRVQRLVDHWIMMLDILSLLIATRTDQQTWPTKVSPAWLVSFCNKHSFWIVLVVLYVFFIIAGHWLDLKPGVMVIAGIFLKFLLHWHHCKLLLNLVWVLSSDPPLQHNVLCGVPCTAVSVSTMPKSTVCICASTRTLLH